MNNAKPQKPLTTLHLQTAAVERKAIAAYSEEGCEGTGIVEEVTDNYVKISGTYYVRGEYEFYYA